MSDLRIDLTKEQLDEIEERCNAATPGPWTWRKTRWGKVGPNILLTAPDMEVLDSVSQPHILKVDSEFIAHARIDLPLLLAMARQKIELEAKVQVLTTCLETWQEALQLTQDESYARGVRVQELEAQAAALREALGLADKLYQYGVDAGYCSNPDYPEHQVAIVNADRIFSVISQALSGEASKALLKRQEELLVLIDDLADSLQDFGGTQDERRGSMYRRAAEALDRADALVKEVRGG